MAVGKMIDLIPHIINKSIKIKIKREGDEEPDLRSLERRPEPGHSSFEMIPPLESSKTLPLKP